MADRLSPVQVIRGRRADVAIGRLEELLADGYRLSTDDGLRLLALLATATMDTGEITPEQRKWLLTLGEPL